YPHELNPSAYPNGTRIERASNISDGGRGSRESDTQYGSVVTAKGTLMEFGPAIGRGEKKRTKTLPGAACPIFRNRSASRSFFLPCNLAEPALSEARHREPWMI